MSLSLVFGWLHYQNLISNEILTLISPQNERSSLEKHLFSGDSVTVNFQCEGHSADRWILNMTTTANRSNPGLLRIEADNAWPRTIRTQFFSKFAGTYTIPLLKKNGSLPKRVSVKFSLTGGNEDEPLLYFPMTMISNSSFYDISLQPEKGETVNLPDNVVYPLFIEKFSRSGTCKIISDVNLLN
jgi:hypothetical protein